MIFNQQLIENNRFMFAKKWALYGYIRDILWPAFEKVDLTWTFHGLIIRNSRINDP